MSLLVSSMPSVAGNAKSYGKATGRHEYPNGENVWLKNDIANEETTNGVIVVNACGSGIHGYICC